MTKLTMYNSKKSRHLLTITNVVRLSPNTIETGVHLLSIDLMRKVFIIQEKMSTTP